MSIETFIGALAFLSAWTLATGWLFYRAGHSDGAAKEKKS
jgi:hypothetical protein